MEYTEPRYLTEVEVSEITRMSLSTLRNDRFRRQGIPYVKIGRSVRYNLLDVIEFMESRKIQTEWNELSNGCDVMRQFLKQGLLRFSRLDLGNS